MPEDVPVHLILLALLEKCIDGATQDFLVHPGKDCHYELELLYLLVNGSNHPQSLSIKNLEHNFLLISAH
jgi:hypothetical protein